MVFTVARKIKGNQYNYQVSTEPEYAVMTNCTLGFARRKIVAYHSATMIYELKQTNWVKKVLSILFAPIIPTRTWPVYQFYAGMTCQGETMPHAFTPKEELALGCIKYEFYLHSQNYISIMKNGEQIALLKKADITTEEQNLYSVTLDTSLEPDLLKVILFTAFIDVIYYPNHFKLSYWKYEKTVGKETFPERLRWKPEEDKGTVLLEDKGTVLLS